MSALSRRAFLAGAARTAARTATGTAAAALAAGGLGSLLSACDSAGLNPDLFKPSPPPAPERPVTWPISAANKPIANGLLAERDATLAVYTWPGRIAAECLHKFSRKYGCHVQVTTFGSISEATATVTTKPTRFDVLLGVPVALLGTLIGSDLIQPLNHSYIPNISQVWEQFTDPFYDQNWQYTVPYTIYTTGIGWRKDLVEADPYSMLNGWELLWRPEYNGHVAMLDDYREGLGLGLLVDGITNLNTADPMQLDDAARSLTQLGTLVHPRLSNTAFRDLTTGTTWVQHAWSGQVTAAAKNLPPGIPQDVLGYWFPPSGAGPAANDTITIPRSAQNPVLAHLFMNFMLDTPNAVTNARGIGYMQPVSWMTPKRLMHYGVLPPALLSAVVLESEFWRGLKELQLLSGADALWQQAWQSAVTNMRLSPIQ
jgi:spermidine/putrescine transport system substrate-binding protein